MASLLSNDPMIGRKVYQLAHVIDVDETVLLTTLDEDKADSLLLAIVNHDKQVPAEAEALKEWDSTHPLKQWAELLTGGDSFSYALPHLERETWGSAIIKTTFTLE